MECPYVSYGDFSRRIHSKLAGQRLPISGSIELTPRCNLQCVHCYINEPAGDPAIRQRELTTDEFRRVIDQIVDAGCFWLLLTGGEPFVRPDALDIYTYAKQKGLLITLFTNGTTITPPITDYLAEWPPFAIEITLYGYTKETYERVTGIPGSYQRCRRGIDLLVERGLPLRLKTMALTLNRHELDDMQAFADRLGVEFRFDPTLNLRLDGGQQPAACRLSPQEVVALDLGSDKRVQAWREFIDQYSGPSPQPELLYQCGAGVQSFHIDAFGELSLCLMARQPGYDLRQGTFQEGWQFLAEARSQRRTAASPCQTCNLSGICDVCPGVARMEHGDPEQPVPYLCEITHRRAEILLVDGVRK